MAVLPSADSAREAPCRAVPTLPVPTSLVPCWVQTPPLWMNTQAAPADELSTGPPTMAVLPSPDSATEVPCRALPTAPVPTSLVPCWVQTPPLRVKTHAAPARELSLSPPTIAVLPSADSATEVPWRAFPTAPLPTSLVPCWLQTPPLRVKTHAAPADELSESPPTIAVLPSADSAMATPWPAFPTAPVPTSLLPCWLQTPPLRVKTHAAPAFELSAIPPTMAVLPSPDRATE
jgi:hypothetical protein